MSTLSSFSAPWITASAPDDYSPRWPAAPWIAPAPGQPTHGEAFFRYSFTVADPADLAFAALHLSGRHRTDVHLNPTSRTGGVEWLGSRYFAISTSKGRHYSGVRFQWIWGE
jgi:DNA-binding helix-hairpin-helix protein with protein kinase domain